jgi:hypothetical protein
MDANSLTPAELRALADKKEQESTPIKEGFLKVDLYDFDAQYSSDPPGRYQIPEEQLDFWLFTKQQQKEIIKNFTESFSKVLSKGARFLCFLDDGKEDWYDDVGYGVEAMDADWAAKYLEKIRKL